MCLDLILASGRRSRLLGFNPRNSTESLSESFEATDKLRDLVFCHPLCLRYMDPTINRGIR